MQQCYVCAKPIDKGTGAVDVEAGGWPATRHEHCPPRDIISAASSWEWSFRRIVREEMRAALAELALDDSTGGEHMR